jgi:hypothetical protein
MIERDAQGALSHFRGVDAQGKRWLTAQVGDDSVSGARAGGEARLASARGHAGARGTTCT